MNRRGFFSAIASAVLAGVAIPRERIVVAHAITDEEIEERYIRPAVEACWARVGEEALEYSRVLEYHTVPCPHFVRLNCAILPWESST